MSKHALRLKDMRDDILYVHLMINIWVPQGGPKKNCYVYFRVNPLLLFLATKKSPLFLGLSEKC